MAYYSLLRRASSSVVPLAIRTLGSPRSFRGSISTSLLKAHSSKLYRKSFIPSVQNFSTSKKHSSEDNLIRVINNEITCAEEEENDVENIPEKFPFEIQDNPGERTVSLKREYQDEVITVLVDMPSYEAEGEENHESDADNADDAEDENANNSGLPLVVSVFKGDGLSLEFGVTAFEDQIVIDTLSIKNPEISDDQIAYEGPDFSDLDEHLQGALLKYLEIRGIKPSTTNFLQDYMISKDQKEYLQWLKNLKGFIQK